MADVQAPSDEVIASIMDGLPAFVDVATDYRPDEAPNFWNVSPVGKWDVDFSIGERFAEQAIVYSSTKGLPILIAKTIESMIRNGRLGPMEFGFLSKIASSATVGALN